MELNTLFGQASSDRRATARIPAGATLLHRAVGMRDYAPCAVVSVTTSGVELLGERPLEPGTVVTILVRPEASPGKYYRVIGSVVRREASPVAACNQGSHKTTVVDHVHL